MKILIVGAHPDDEILGCGGTIASESAKGNEVFIAILGEGITSRYENRDNVDPELINNLHEQSSQAGALLGAKKVFNYNLPDNRFDTVPLLEVVKIIEKLIDELKPSVIYTHYGGDLNIDHVITHRAVLTATRSLKNQPVRDLYSFEVPSSTEWAFGQYSGGFNPNVFIDISKTLDLKIKAMQVYEDETRAFPHPRSPENYRAIAKFRGSSSGLLAAEAFELIKSIR